MEFFTRSFIYYFVITFSSILDSIGSMDIGLQFKDFSLSLFLCNGTIISVFHTFGTVQVTMELFTITVFYGPII